MLTNQRKAVTQLREIVNSVSPSQSQHFDWLKGLPFYHWSDSKGVIDISHFDTTFNNVIGLPQKEGRPYPLFDYEKILYDTLQTNKHVWIKKATGLGVTEFMLRYMAWLCFNDLQSTCKIARCAS